MSELWVALVSLVGTIIGSMGGIIVSAKLTNFRLKTLEEKVEQHNRFGLSITAMQEQLKTLFHTVDEIKERIGNRDN